MKKILIFIYSLYYFALGAQQINHSTQNIVFHDSITYKTGLKGDVIISYLLNDTTYLFFDFYNSQLELAFQNQNQNQKFSVLNLPFRKEYCRSALINDYNLWLNCIDGIYRYDIREAKAKKILSKNFIYSSFYINKTDTFLIILNTSCNQIVRYKLTKGKLKTTDKHKISLPFSNEIYTLNIGDQYSIKQINDTIISMNNIFYPIVFLYNIHKREMVQILFNPSIKNDVNLGSYKQNKNSKINFNYLDYISIGTKNYYYQIITQKKQDYHDYEDNYLQYYKDLKNELVLWNANFALTQKITFPYEFLSFHDGKVYSCKYEPGYIVIYKQSIQDKEE